MLMAATAIAARFESGEFSLANAKDSFTFFLLPVTIPTAIPAKRGAISPTTTSDTADDRVLNAPYSNLSIQGSTRRAVYWTKIPHDELVAGTRPRENKERATPPPQHGRRPIHQALRVVPSCQVEHPPRSLEPAIRRWLNR